MKNLAKVSVFALFVAVMAVACNNAPKTEESTSTSSTSTETVSSTPDSTHNNTAATPDTTKK